MWVVCVILMVICGFCGFMLGIAYGQERGDFLEDGRRSRKID